MGSRFEVWLGLGLDEQHLLPVDDLAPGTARLGTLIRGPAGLLHDLELRLGLGALALAPGVRVARYGARLAALAPAGRFYSASHALDAWGTAEELLRWRDLLVDAGWEGEAPDGAGARLAELAELERLGDAAEIAGTPDRLRAVTAVAGTRAALYHALHLIDPPQLFSRRWQALFAALETSGTVVSAAAFAPPLAPEESDLGRLQRHFLRGGPPVPPRGDGSLWLLRAETVWEAAHAAAALLGPPAAPDVAIIRAGSALALEYALAGAGLGQQGVRCRHRLRPILQVVSLALELAFEPKDPKRVLELLALPDGPFRGLERGLLAEAMRKMPGLGNSAWEQAKRTLAERLRARAALPVPADDDGAPAADVEAQIARRLERIHAWIEAPGAPASGAERGRLIAVVQRVQRWLQGRLAALDQRHAGDDHDAAGRERARLGMALGHVTSLAATLAAEARPTLTLLQVRQLAEATLGGGAALELHEEQAGRLDHVATPANLLAPRDTVLWWSCLADCAEQPPRLPFDRRELDALGRAGVQLPDRRRIVAHLAAGWRRALTMARRRLILVAPRCVRGDESAPHPIWDELCVRLGGERQALARVTVESSALRGGSVTAAGALAVAPRDELALPAARPEWRIDAQALAPTARLSATAIESLVGCPLRFVLDVKAQLRPGALASLPAGPVLNGTLGHRLVEKLHEERAFALTPDALGRRADAVLADLLPREAASLLLPGQRAELAQVRRQLVSSVTRLANLLRRSQLAIVAVEKDERTVWREAELSGRLDLLLVDGQGRDVVLDLKWGRSSYVELLDAGCAVQLAVYAWLRRCAGGDAPFPAVAYFSLSRGIALATDARTFAGAQVVAGADVATTWGRIEHSVALVERTLAAGSVPVTGVTRGLPTPLACGATPGDARHLPLANGAACGYCAHDAVCGRRWEARP